MLTFFIFVNEVGNAECCSNLEANTVVLLQNTYVHHITNTSLTAFNYVTKSSDCNIAPISKYTKLTNYKMNYTAQSQAYRAEKVMQHYKI